MGVLIANWYLVIASIVVVAMCLIAVSRFLEQHKQQQIRKVREWLLYVVIEAEAKFYQDGVGRLKLRYVYDKFVQQFRWISIIISFETFSMLVDLALLEMKEMLQNNKGVQEYVKSKDRL